MQGAKCQNFMDRVDPKKVRTDIIFGENKE